MKLKEFLACGTLAAVAVFGLASCDNIGSGVSESNSSSTSSQTSESAPSSSTAPETSTSSQASEGVPSSSSSTTPAASSSSTAESSQAATYDDSSLAAHKLYVVGDSTVCSFSDPYLYPRYGYGTQLSNYISSKLEVVNLALSGRSSKSFLAEGNYTTLKNSISAGDYLMIGFGHNDEKSDDADRYTSALLPTTDSASFKYSLYENYVKLAEEKGATPILCTPIVRLAKDDNYSGSNGHVTANGDYAQAIVDLGQEKNVQVVNLRDITKTKYEALGYDEAIYYHAMTTAKDATLAPKLDSVDATHINIYGAKFVAYSACNVLYNSNCSIKDYINPTKLAEPTKANDLKASSSYTYVAYSPMDLSKYTMADHLKTTSEGWYGTAFGDCGGDPSSASNGYFAKETETGVFKVGQSKGTASSAFKGKIADAYGIAFAFKQVSVNDNFTITAEAKVLNQDSDGKQAGFGLMLRDDCYKPTKDASIVSNYVAAGLLLNSDGSMTANFSEENSKCVKSSNKVTGQIVVNDTATFTIKRLGQVVTCTTVYKGQTYTTTYTDFDFVSKDGQYFYVGMFGARGVIGEFTNVTYTYDGAAQGA